MASNHTLLESIRHGLSDACGTIPTLQWIRDLSGGDINRAALLRSGATDWFLKYHPNVSSDMFAAEAQALREIARQACIRVPAPIAYGSDGNTAWLVLEYLQLSHNGSESLLGEQLAALHAVSFEHHGWSRDNFIGSTPQHNTRCENWMVFWRDQRLRPQLAMAQAGGRLAQLGEQLLEAMDQVMDGHQPVASLLHGDLWAGNKAYTPDAQPVIFDPASYHGDRETDIAMTELFGGFAAEFYSAYQAHAPLPDGYRLRRDLYNLYHILNHLNLFGGGYLARAENLVSKLLAQVR